MHPVLFFLHLINEIKLFHWMTQSYAKHMATDALVSKLQDLSDKFVEVYIGKYGRPNFNKKELAFALKVHDNQEVINHAMIYLTTHVMSYIKPADGDLLNIRDEMLAELNQAKYRLTLC